jgi:hypothetical protein
VAPLEQDSCEPGADESCNGKPNEGCPCTDSESRACGSNTGNCRRGTQTCEGGAWSQCEGGIKAAAQDSCALVGDDANCNGTANDGCVCVGNATEDCNDCGTRSCNPTLRAWGKCTAAQAPAASRCATSKTLQICDSAGRWQPTPCTSADSHCTSRCEDGAGSAGCVVKAADVDGDSFGDTLCSLASGTDCDDAHDTVYPGASETCDGLDNDCDGATDLNDGLTLSGSNQAIAERSSIDLAWNPYLSHFGWVAHRSYQNWLAIFSGSLSTAGVLGTRETPTFANIGVDYIRPHLAYSSNASAGSNGYGIVYYQGNQGGVAAHWSYMNGYGGTGADYVFSNSSDPAIATLSSNDFVMAFPAGGNLTFGRIQAGQSLVDSTTIPEGPTFVRIAAAGTQSAVVYHSGQKIKWVRASSAFVLGSPAELAADGGEPDITGTSNGYAVAWPTADGAVFSLVKADGTPICNRSVLFGNAQLQSGDAVAVEQTAYGTVMLTTERASGIRIYRFDDACKTIDSQELSAPTSDGVNAPTMAVGGGKIAVAWNVATTTEGTVGNVRLLNERLCQ